VTALCLDSLKKLRERTCGHPGDLASLEEWQAEIDKMIDGFEAASLLAGEPEALWQERERRWRELHGEESPYSWREVPGTEFSEFVVHPDMERIDAEIGFWEALENERRELEVRMKAGLGVFVERFLNLWD